MTEESGDSITVVEDGTLGESSTATMSKIAAGKVIKKARQIIDQAKVVPGGKTGIKHKPISHMVSSK